jgi:hypothetical protein
MSPDVPIAMHMTVTFEVLAGMTRSTLRHAGFPPGQIHDSGRGGEKESLDNFESILALAEYKNKTRTPAD